MADLKISQLPARTSLSGSDELLNLASNTNYRSPLSSVATHVRGTLATVATSGSASDLTTGTLPAARIANNSLSIAQTSGLQSALDGKEALGLLAGINTQTASYTLALSDIGKAVEMNVGSANNLTVPTNAAVAFAIGSRIDITQLGAGQTTVVAAGGVTIRQREGKLKLAGQYAGASLYKRATDEWLLFGDLTT